MKVQLPATSAVTVALAAASVALALLLLPSGGTSVGAAGVAPALRLVAGDVAAIVQAPPHAAAKPQARPRSVVSPSVGVAATHPRTQPGHSAHSATRSVRAHTAASRDRVPSKQVVRRATAKTTVLRAPHVLTLPVRHGNGKAKAVGHLKKAKAKAVGHRKNAKAVGRRPKAAPTATAASKPGPGAAAKADHALAQSTPAVVSHGPPAAPPGQVKKASGGHGDPNGRGGGK